MRRKVLLWGGVLGPIIYALAVILGGLFTSGYSHMTHAVSELIQAGAANKAWLDPIFLVYNLCILAFGLGLLAVVEARDSSQAQRRGVASAWMFVTIGILGLLLLLFPVDPIGAAATLPGTIHLVLAGLASLFTMIAILLAGLWFGSVPRLRPYAAYAFATVALVFLTGLGAVATTATGVPLTGLLERLTIGAFLQWVLMMSLLLAPRLSRPRDVRSVGW